MSFVGALLSDPSIPLSVRQAALARAVADPGIPDPRNSTKSFWLKDPHPKLARLQSNTLPSEAEVVIIGSGISGTSIAKTILEAQATSKNKGKSRNPKVVILEARDVCSGATGRNGGHLLETADEFGEYVDRFGLEAARKLMRFRLAHLHEVLAVVDQLGLTEETQARKVQFLSAYFDDETWKEALERLARFKEGLPAESAEWVAYEGDKIPKKFLIPTAKGIVAGPAGAIWPYKLVTALLDRLTREYPNEFLLETNTPVTAISRNDGSGGSELKYAITTPRGTIHAKHIIHSTNAHAAHLLPGLRGRIYPIRGQMSAQAPGQKFPDHSRQHSWLFSYERGFDYLTQLPKGPLSNNEMMFGGGFAQGKGSGIDDLGIATDSDLSLYCDIHLSGAMSAVFSRENWGAVPSDSPAVKMMWTGNMGFSADGLPWVGKVGASVTGRGEDARSAQAGAEWISAAFSGEGMVHAWLCGKAVARMLLADEGVLSPEELAQDRSWFPEQMLVTEKRVREAVLPGVEKRITAKI